MMRGGSSEPLPDVVETLIEGQAMLASSLYIELVNLGLIDKRAAADRLRALATLAASPLQQHPEVAAALAARIDRYAAGMEAAAAADADPRTQLRVIEGGRL